MSPERFRASIKAAGGVLYRSNDDGEREFLLVHRPRYDDWSLPKGKLDRREGYLEAGLREVREETGRLARQREGWAAVQPDTKRREERSLFATEIG